MTLQEFFGDPKCKAMYDDWRSRADTKVILDIYRDNFGARGLSPQDRVGEKALYYCGCVDTVAASLVFLTNMPDVVAIQKQLTASNALEADYGRDDILRKQEAR
jgi:hypothetical protein